MSFPDNSVTGHRKQLHSLALAVVFLFAALVRIWASFDEFWLDEIWSTRLAEDAHSPLGIITELHHDNNHYLMTLWMYFWGPRTGWMIYRVPSLVAGIGTVVLASKCAARWGAVESLTAAILTAASYPLIVYASEARGYALAGFFALAAYLVLDSYLSTPRAWKAIAFSLCAILGVLSHLTFVQFYVGALVWSALRLCRAEPTRRALPKLALCHAAPFGFLLALYFVDVRHIIVGGGPPYSIANVIAKTLAITAGGPSEGAWSIPFALLIAAAGIAGLALLRRDRSDLATLFGTIIFVMPGLLLAVSRPEFLHLRYFYIGVVFYLILLSYLLGRIWRLGRLGMAAAALAVTLMVAGNVARTWHFVAIGREHYFELVQYLVEHTSAPVIRVQSDSDFRNSVLLRYYFPRASSPLPMQYYLRTTEWDTPPEWFIKQGYDAPYAPPSSLVDREGNRYELSAVFPSAGLSPLPGAVYHLAKH